MTIKKILLILLMIMMLCACSDYKKCNLQNVSFLVPREWRLNNKYDYSYTFNYEGEVICDIDYIKSYSDTYSFASYIYLISKNVIKEEYGNNLYTRYKYEHNSSTYYMAIGKEDLLSFCFSKNVDDGTIEKVLSSITIY